MSFKAAPESMITQLNSVISFGALKLVSLELNCSRVDIIYDLEARATCESEASSSFFCHFCMRFDSSYSLAVG